MRSDSRPGCRLPLACSFKYTAIGEDADEGHCDHDQDNEYQRAGPCKPMPLIIWGDRIDIDLEREGRYGLVQLEAPELVSEGGEQERCGLACYASEREHAARDDSQCHCAQADSAV